MERTIKNPTALKRTPRGRRGVTMKWRCCSLSAFPSDLLCAESVFLEWGRKRSMKIPVDGSVDWYLNMQIALSHEERRGGRRKEGSSSLRGVCFPCVVVLLLCSSLLVFTYEGGGGRGAGKRNQSLFALEENIQSAISHLSIDTTGMGNCKTLVAILPLRFVSPRCSYHSTATMISVFPLTSSLPPSE